MTSTSTSTPSAVPIEALLAHKDWVRTLAVRLATDAGAADDLEQETWLEALRHPPADDHNLRGWLTRVTRSVARKDVRSGTRRQRRERANARPEAQPSAARVVVEAETQRNVVNAVLALAEPYRRTILLRFYEGLPPRDVARETGVPVETVRTRTRRALAQIRERLAEIDGPEWLGALTPLLAPPSGGPSTGSLAQTQQGALMSTNAVVGAVAVLVVVGGVALVFGSGVLDSDAGTTADDAAKTAQVDADRADSPRSGDSGPASVPDNGAPVGSSETAPDTTPEKSDAGPGPADGSSRSGQSTGSHDHGDDEIMDHFETQPPPAIPATKAGKGKRVSLDFSGVALSEIAEMIAMLSGETVDLSDEAVAETKSVPVTLKLKDVTAADALKTVARLAGREYRLADGVHYID
jgi:RNA polymerase sigma-70 factor (ECF subfamily)